MASRDIEKTENDQIFVERQPAVTQEELRGKLAVLEAALEKNDPSVIRGALRMVVPHFHEPEEVNKDQGEEVVIPGTGDRSPLFQELLLTPRRNVLFGQASVKMLPA